MLPPPQEAMEKLGNMVSDGRYYVSRQFSDRISIQGDGDIGEHGDRISIQFKMQGARYMTAQRYNEALEVLESGAITQLQHHQVTCGAELAALFVETLVKGKVPFSVEILDRVRKIYETFPRISMPHHLVDADDDDMQKLSEALVAARTRVEGCSSFLRSAIRWSVEFGAPRSGYPELHDMLAEYLYSESPDLDMAKVSMHFVRGNNPKTFASTIVNFMGKCYPGEDDLAIARAVLMYLAQGNLRDANDLMDEIRNQLECKELVFPESDLTQFIIYLLQTLERDALPLFRMLRQKYQSSIDREPLFNELLDEIAEKFYGLRRQSGLQGMFGDFFKMMGEAP